MPRFVTLFGQDLIENKLYSEELLLKSTSDVISHETSVA